MSDNFLRVGTTIDLSGWQAGIPQAAALIEESTARMTKAFDRARDASGRFTADTNKVKQAAGEVADGMNVAGTALDDATEKVKTAGDVWSRIFTGLAHPFKEGNWKEFSEGVEEMIAHPLRSAGAAAKDMLIELGPMGAIGVAVSATFAELGHKAYELVNEEGAAARQTQNLANRLGLTFEQAKKLSEMARIVDTDIGSLARAAFKLSDALQNPGSKEAEEVKKLGVTATETGPALLEVLEKLAAITNGTERMAKAREILGRAAVSLQPVISDYERLSAAVEELGGKVSDEGVKGLLDAREKINELGIAWDHLKEAFAAKLSPLVTVVVDAIVRTVAGGKEGEKGSPSYGAPEWERQAGWQQGGGSSLPFVRPSLFNLSHSKPEPGPATFGAADLGRMAMISDAQKKLQTDQAKAAADAFDAAFAKTLDGLKKKLEEVHKKVEAAEGKKDKSAFDAASKQELSIKEQIKAAEKTQSGAAVAERNAVIEKQVEQDKKLALTRIDIAKDAAKRMYDNGQATTAQELAALVTAENLRYEIEKNAAERINALKAATAKAEHKPAGAGISIAELGLQHQKNLMDINGASAAESKKEADFAAKFWIDALGRIQKERQKDLAEQVKELAEKTKREAGATAVEEQEEIAHSTRVYERNKEIVEAEFQAKRISVQQKIQLLKQLELQEYQTQMAAAGNEYKVASGSGDAEATAKAQAKIQGLADRFAVARTKLDGQAAQSAVTMQKLYITAIGNIGNAFDRGMESWISRQKRFGQAMGDSFRGMADQAIMNIVRMTTQMLASFAVQKILGQESVMSSAYQSAAHTWKNVTASGVGGPFNPVIAAAEAAGVFALVSALGTFEHGGVVPKTGINLVHAGERVLTERQNQNIERLADGGGGGPVYNYHAAPGESPDSVSRNAQQYQRLMRDGRLRFA